MAIGLKTHKMLWGRGGNVCAICKQQLVLDETETDDPSLVGEECHIVARKKDGPRGISELTAEQRDLYANLILLCRNHHKMIDDQVEAYTVYRLTKITQQHEAWVKETIGIDHQKQLDEEIYATYIQSWADKARLDEWNSWASDFMCSGQPCISVDMKAALDEIGPWLLSRVWPGRYSELESAFQNFRLISQDLCGVFGEHATKRGSDIWETEKFYKIREWDPERYERLAEAYNEHVALVQDLALELTRAANYVCDFVRQHVSRNYRMDEGAVLITSGPFMDLTMKTYRVEYRGEERTANPYPGLEDFMTSRFTRDVYFGTPPDPQPELGG